MNEHMTQHLDAAVYTCHECDNFDAESVDELNQHLAEVHYTVRINSYGASTEIRLPPA